MSTDTFAAPVVRTGGSTDPTAPLVVLLHGRGANETSLLGLAAHLPETVAHAAVRAPIAEGGGHAWFANRGIGRPRAESLRATMDWFRDWLDEAAHPGRPVVLIGFSGGAAFAGGLVLDDPTRYAGVAILHGTLPFDAGVPTTAGRLAGLPVFVSQGDGDHVIPRELLDRTWSYLLAESGAPVVATRDPGGHQISAAVAGGLLAWVAQRVEFLEQHQAATSSAVAWPGLPERSGPAPEASWSIPQQQTSQNAPIELQERLFAEVRQLAGVGVSESRISVPGARAFTQAEPSADTEAFLVPQVQEFAHLHPHHDGSLHLPLPPQLAAEVSTQGWGRPHMWAGTRLSPGFMLVYGPRDEEEFAVIRSIVEASHAYARA